MQEEFVIVGSRQAKHLLAESNVVPRLMDNKAAMEAAGPPYHAWSGDRRFFAVAASVITDDNHAKVRAVLEALPRHTIDTDVIFLPPGQAAQETEAATPTD